ncbi:hypothetical protein HCN44_008878 [Aphidius gifuensis]|uniref:Aminomethyltransferase n=1 Tax=Aphidius gifuensis TaxID=684658 RepID=A0A834Y434_APHGI|nr:hypothetical protein HCN44_008878 [Aphidius gifuensis]
MFKTKCHQWYLSNRAYKFNRIEVKKISSNSPEVKKTCMYDFHVKNNGKMVNFSNFLLPLKYEDSIEISHQHTRTNASLFDVGHMLQTEISGNNAAEYLESLTTADLKNLNQGASVLTVFTNDNGGILDDLIITKDSENKFFVVSNAGRRNEDMEIFEKRKNEYKIQEKQISLIHFDPSEYGLVALQGPSAAGILQSFVDIDLTKLKFMNSVKTKILKMECRISRCGYTGEDGFEISSQGNNIKILAEKFLYSTDVKLAEAGLCLYGHDIDENTTPIEAGLGWLVARRRKQNSDFPGAKKILSQIKEGVEKKRIGLTLENGPAARENTPILSLNGEFIGAVTSGGRSPTLKKPIAMGYVPPEQGKIGSKVLVDVRGKIYEAIVTKMPFVQTNYYTDKKK